LILVVSVWFLKITLPVRLAHELEFEICTLTGQSRSLKK
jgi:hypothetical protein